MEGESIEHVKLVSPKVNDSNDKNVLETDLDALVGVRSVLVDPATHSVSVAFDPRVVDANRIEEVMQQNGYNVSSVAYASPRDEAEQ